MAPSPGTHWPQVSESPLANVVDANYSAAAKVPKALLPAATAFGGIHAHLRDLAATLRSGFFTRMFLAASW
jgi:hypothetical protein